MVILSRAAVEGTIERKYARVGLNFMAEHRYPLKLFLRQLPIRIMVIITIILNLAAWGWLIWHIRPQEAPLFLHYNVLFGVDLTGNWFSVFYVPFAGLAIFGLNTMLGWMLYQRDKFVPQVLMGIAMMCNAFVLIQAALLVFLNV